VALGTCGVAIAVALVLGILVWRSVHRPIQVLHDAALALGEGRLDTRVAISSRDEMGVLADAFNKMAGQLEATTVSVTSLENMFASMAAGVILCDQQGRITNSNRAAQVLLDRERGELAGLPFAAVCPGPAAGPGDPPGSVERAFLRRDGTGLPVSLSVSELRSAGGALQGKVYVAQDLTPMKRIEARLRESLGEKELLLREVHHRVKNNMQVISSLLAMQSTSGDPQVRERLDESQHRIRTIALIHEQLYQSTEVAHIDVRSYLDVLANHLLQTFGMADRIELVQDIAPLDVDLDQSLACGLIVNELLTNALKYAFPDHRRGTIRLSLRERADGTRVLEVADDGRGMPSPTPGEARKTLGTSLVAQLARQLRGRVEIDGSQGTTVRIVFARQAPVPTVTP
jgi:PAS domain S-box-containing protein